MCVCIICIFFFSCSPPVNPEAEIDDPTDTKPADWDEREKYLFILLLEIYISISSLAY